MIGKNATSKVLSKYESTVLTVIIMKYTDACALLGIEQLLICKPDDSKYEKY